MLIREAYTSHCDHLNKVASRTDRFGPCDDRAHRDGVGAVNILNKGMHGEILPSTILVPKRITYRLNVPLRGTLKRSCG